MNAISIQAVLTLRAIMRDRVLHAVCGVAVLLILLVPVFSSFSMRQVQESSINLALSASSFILLVLATQLGSTAIFRDIDRRYTTAVLSLPISRSQFVIGRFFGIVLFLAGTILILAAGSTLVILYATSTYPSPRPIAWGTLALAFAADYFKFVLLTSVAVFFSSMSTSLTLPFFSTLAVYLAGSASQEVFEYISGSFGDKIPVFFRQLTELIYYLVPNFSGFDLHVQAIYGLDIIPGDVCLSLLYGVLYAMVIIWCTVWIFGRRELP